MNIKHSVNFRSTTINQDQPSLDRDILRYTLTSICFFVYTYMNRSLAVNVLKFRVVASSFYGEMKTQYWNGIKGNLELMKERTCPIYFSFLHASFPAGFLPGLGVPPLHRCRGDE